MGTHPAPTTTVAAPSSTVTGTGDVLWSRTAASARGTARSRATSSSTRSGVARGGTTASSATARQSSCTTLTFSESVCAIRQSGALEDAIVHSHTLVRSFSCPTSVRLRRQIHLRSSLPTDSRRSGARSVDLMIGRIASMHIPTVIGDEPLSSGILHGLVRSGPAASRMDPRSLTMTTDAPGAWLAPWRTGARSSCTTLSSTRRAHAVRPFASGGRCAHSRTGLMTPATPARRRTTRRAPRITRKM
mmetsp:Transcript_41854/g.105193  ORF Transcript_41854/g.105193 Transcript_41854/m.105193 type:complete len:246 (-) Transcript_41854:861-1598(-)